MTLRCHECLLESRGREYVKKERAVTRQFVWWPEAEAGAALADCSTHARRVLALTSTPAAARLLVQTHLPQSPVLTSVLLVLGEARLLYPVSAHPFLSGHSLWNSFSHQVAYCYPGAMSLAPDLSAPGLTTFESLSDDCLLCVVDELKKMVCVYTLVMRRPNPDLQAFSGVNKRLRQLCIPVMFNLEHLTIKLWQRKSILIPQLKALQQSFAAERVKALAIDRFFETDNDSALLGQQIATTLPSLSNLRELYLAHTTMFDSAAKAALSLVSLDLVEKLSVKDVPDSACFIRACPNLRVFVSDFPCNKPKTTLKVLSESPVDGLELQNYNGWKPKQLEGGYPQRAFTDHADECATELCQYLGHITRLSLEGRIKVKPTVSHAGSSQEACLTVYRTLYTVCSLCKISRLSPLPLNLGSANGAAIPSRPCSMIPSKTPWPSSMKSPWMSLALHSPPSPRLKLFA